MAFLSCCCCGIDYHTWVCNYKSFIGLFSGCIIWGIQSAKCKREYERTYHVRVETDDEGNIIHAEKL